MGFKGNVIQELERVVLTVDLPEYQLQAGDVGVVVMIHKDGAGYEVEFFMLDGETLDVATVEAQQVRPVSRRDVLHVRAIPERA